MKNNQKGQALIELIIFLPLMLMFYTMISGFANAINGSINQQKITRAYFYYRTQGNSTVPKPAATGGAGNYSHSSWTLFGMYFIGWTDYLDASKPVAPCYKLTVPLQPTGGDICENQYTTPSTQFIRVQTVYGICGGTYELVGGEVYSTPDYQGMAFSTLIGRSSCIIQ